MSGKRPCRWMFVKPQAWPPGDQVDWRIEDGEIRGRKIEPESCDVLEFDDVDPVTLAPKIGMITEESIVRAVREDRDQCQ